MCLSVCKLQWVEIPKKEARIIVKIGFVDIIIKLMLHTGANSNVQNL